MDRPWWQQYLVWLGGLLRGDFGYSFEYDMPVSAVVGDRMLLTIIVSFATILFTWAVSFPIGVYSATHKYSVSDHALTLLGFLGLATPNFLLALVLLYFANVVVRHLDRRPDGPAVSRPADELGASSARCSRTSGCR